MKIKKLDPNAIQPVEDPAATEDKPVTSTPERMHLRVRTAVRAGDLYMQYPRGSTSSGPTRLT